MKIIFEESNIRLDKYLSYIYKDKSRSFLSKKIKNKDILVNEKAIKPSYILEKGDIIDILNIEDETIEILPENIKLDIIYEDSHIIIVNKKRGMVVHPGEKNLGGTLVNALLNHTKDLSDLDGDFRPGIVHRLDKNTSGLLVVAKTNEAHSFLKKQILNKNMLREYILLVHGNIKENKFVIDKPIGRDCNNRLKMSINYKHGKKAKTNFEVIKRYEDYTLLVARLTTGRMHQIRVHISDNGNPIVGDEIYGFTKNEFNKKNQLLHSHKIGFIHPYTKEYVEYENDNEDDLNNVLKILNFREG